MPEWTFSSECVWSLFGFRQLKHPFRSLRPLIVSLVPGQQQHLERLKLMRQTLSTELMDVINEYGPKLYDDFDKACGFPAVLGSFLTMNLI